MVLGYSREGFDWTGLIARHAKDEEEKLLKQAIALSLEGAEEKDNEEEDSDEQDTCEYGEEEELTLRQAIALSLKGDDPEESC